MSMDDQQVGDFTETGWAKINLALHVRRRRADGYHELETIFAFVNQGDDLTAELSNEDRLSLEGEFAAGLETGPDNLVMRALHLLRQAQETGAERVPPLHVRLRKNLPVAAGIGGGSADAAAVARMVRDHFLPEISDEHLQHLVAPLGADVASCVTSRTAIGTGTGADLQSAEHLNLQGTPILLVNPRLPVATGPIFKAWDQIDRGALFISENIRSDLLVARNDLQRPAITQCPEITNLLTLLEECRPWLSRMSGSGGTCFALFDSISDRNDAAAKMSAAPHGYWVMAGELR